MKIVKSVDELWSSLKGVVEPSADGVRVASASKLREEGVDTLVWSAVFAENEAVRDTARWAIRAAAREVGIESASIYPLYAAMGRKDCGGFTVPAINVRGLAYDTTRAALRAALKNEVAAVIFEIAKSEIGYTHQRPAEYTAVVLAAGIKEGWKGPMFIQGDHFQMSVAKYKEDPKKETKVIADLIREAIPGGFLNIDIDSSTLVDLSRGSVREQQRDNFEVCAELTRVVRECEPKGVTIAVGGEIGEVGKKNSTEEELREYLNGYLDLIGKGTVGVDKVSIQTGTSHGGIPLPDGSVAEVKLDFDTLARLSRVCVEEYGIAGAVQHGASTLPDEAFHHFPESAACEVHLATGFQNLTYDGGHFPEDLKREIHAHLHEACAGEKKEGETEEQFIYKTRKKAFGPFKRQMWSLSSDVRNRIAADLEAKFDFLFHQLKVGKTRELVDKHVKPVAVPLSKPGK
ncbi:MAG: class II fructose-bisphosphate aldolase [Deltaproteobacteria bacterium]|nr:class II fructose-bisphosphate aldolase [Deltaproteobacteria bacterium]